MRIGHILDAELEKGINEIVKLGDHDEKVVAGEIGEYVVTPDIERHLTTVLQRLDRGVRERKESNVGFWVSGFYGSGKSSFVKVLSYALENPALAGTTAKALLLARTSGGADLQKYLDALAARKPVVVRFDLQSDRDSTKFENESFTEIADRALRRTLGYSASSRIAELEMRLEEEDKLAEFARLYDAQYGAGTWDRQKHKEEPGLDRASAIMFQLERATYETAEQWAATEKSSLLTAKTFSARAAQLVNRRRGKDCPIIFVADEVGHFVSRSSDRMQDVQGIVEALGMELRGRAWLFVTAQERLDTVWSATGKEQSELPKIQDRYFFVDLAPKDIGEVTQRRLLRKKPEGEKELKTRFAKCKEALRTHSELAGAAAFVTNPDLVKLTESNFLAYYPLLPYQVDLFLKIVSGIRDRGGVHRRTGGAARTLIRLVQDILTQNVDIRLADAEVGQLATLDMVYDQQVANLPSERRTDIDTVVAAFKDDGLAIKVAKALCVLEYADQSAGVGSSAVTDKSRAIVPRTVENVAAVLHPGIDAESLTEGVRAALGRLEEKGKVRKTPHGFELLTPAAQKWEDERAKLRIDRADRLAQVRQAAKEVLDDVSSFRHERGRKFSVEWLLDGRPLIGGARDLRIEIRRPEKGQEFDLAVRAAEAATRKDAEVLAWVFAGWDAIEDTADELCMSERMVGVYRDQAGTAFDRLLHDERVRVEDLKRQLRQRIQSAVIDGTLVFGGVPYTGVELGSTLADLGRRAIETITDALYTEYRAASIGADDRLIRAVLEGARFDALPEMLRGGPEGIALLVQDGGRWDIDRQGRLASHVLSALGTQGKRAPELEQHFRRIPFGWQEDTLRLLLAALFRGGVIKVTYKGRTLTTPTEPMGTEPFLTRSAFSSAFFARRGDRLSNKDLVAASRAIGRVLRESVEADEGAIHRGVAELYARRRDELVGLEARLRVLGLAGAERATRAQETLRSLGSSSALDAAESLSKTGDDLADDLKWAEDASKALSEVGTARVRDARDVLATKVPALETDGAMTDATRESAERLRGWLSSESVIEHLADIATETSTLARAHEALIDGLLEERARTYHEAVEAVRATQSFDELARRAAESADATLEPIARMTRPIDTGAPRPSLGELRAQIAASPALALAAIARVEELVAPAESPPERISVHRYLGRTIDDERTLDERVELLRDACRTALKRGVRIILE